MPRSTIARRDAGVFDKATELRNQSNAALAATTSETGVAIPEAKTALSFRCEVRVLAHTGYTAGTNQWSIAIEASDVLGSGYVPIKTIVPNGSMQTYVFDVRGYELDQLKPNAAFYRATATKTGAPGNLTYGAFFTMLGA